MNARRATDWLDRTAANDTGDDRRGLDRRAGERRAPRLRMDPMFAAILVNHVAPKEAEMSASYPKPSPSLSGLIINTRV